MKILVIGSGGGEDIYNPFLWSRYRLPVRIVIASADGAVSRIVALDDRRAENEPRPRAWYSGMGAFGREFTVFVSSGPDPTPGRSPRSCFGLGQNRPGGVRDRSAPRIRH